jgi:hypothetical protein
MKAMQGKVPSLPCHAVSLRSVKQGMMRDLDIMSLTAVLLSKIPIVELERLKRSSPVVTVVKLLYSIVDLSIIGFRQNELLAAAWLDTFIEHTCLVSADCNDIPSMARNTLTGTSTVNRLQSQHLTEAQTTPAVTVISCRVDEQQFAAA